MARQSPILPILQQAGAILAPYGPDGQEPVPLVQTFGPLELEYASLRKHCVLLDQPHRAVLEVRGPDRLEFLNRMLTQELKGLPLFALRRSFWLNRKGRIDADLRVINLPDRVLLECDIHAGPRALDGLSGYLVMEDAAITDLTPALHSIAVHGPKAVALLPHFLEPRGDGPGLIGLNNRTATLATFAGAEVTIFRDDTTGEPGIEVLAAPGTALALYTRLVEQAGIHDGHAPLTVLQQSADPSGKPTAAFRIRPAGWHAFNIARIEAGSPQYLLDFGPNSLPAESGVIDDRVSFTKGCYLGQEIVARMHSRGHPKQRLVPISFEPDDTMRDAETGLFPQPDTGAPLFLLRGEDSCDESVPVGAITSSTLAPLLGSCPIAFAQVKWDHIAPGTRLVCRADGFLLRGTIREELRALPAR